MLVVNKTAGRVVESKEERTVGFGVQVDDCVDDFIVEKGNGELCDDVELSEDVGDSVDVTRIVEDDTCFVIDDIVDDFCEVDSKVDSTIDEVVASDDKLDDSFVDDDFFGSVVVDDFDEVVDEVDCIIDKVVAVDDKLDETFFDDETSFVGDVVIYDFDEVDGEVDCTIDEVVAGDERLDDIVVGDDTSFVVDVVDDFNEVDDKVDDTTVKVVAGDDRLDNVDEGDDASVVNSGVIFVVSLDDIPTWVVEISVDSVRLVDCSELVVDSVCCVEAKVVAEVVVSTQSPFSIFMSSTPITEPRYPV